MIKEKENVADKKETNRKKERKKMQITMKKEKKKNTVKKERKKERKNLVQTTQQHLVYRIATFYELGSLSIIRLNNVFCWSCVLISYFHSVEVNTENIVNSLSG